MHNIRTTIKLGAVWQVSQRPRVSPPSPLLSPGWPTGIKRSQYSNDKISEIIIRPSIIIATSYLYIFRWTVTRNEKTKRKNKKKRGGVNYMHSSCIVVRLDWAAGLPAWLIRSFGTPDWTRKTLFSSQKHQSHSSRDGNETCTEHVCWFLDVTGHNRKPTRFSSCCKCPVSLLLEIACRADDKTLNIMVRLRWL